MKGGIAISVGTDCGEGLKIWEVRGICGAPSDFPNLGLKGKAFAHRTSINCSSRDPLPKRVATYSSRIFLKSLTMSSPRRVVIRRPST